MTNGEALRVRAAMKPISTVPRALATVDMESGEEAVAIHQRSDVCAVPAAGVVAESMVALVVAQAALEKFGGDSIAETTANYRRYAEASQPDRLDRTHVSMKPKAVLIGPPRCRQIDHRSTSRAGTRTRVGRYRRRDRTDHG